MQKLCRDLPRRHHRGARLQQDVRALRSLHHHVLLQVWYKLFSFFGNDDVVLRNKHIMIDLGTGNNNKINWAMEDKQEMIDIVETIYRFNTEHESLIIIWAAPYLSRLLTMANVFNFRGARKGRGLVVSPKDYSTKYRYWSPATYRTYQIALLVLFPSVSHLVRQRFLVPDIGSSILYSVFI